MSGSCRMQHETPIELLGRPRIPRIKLGKGGDLDGFREHHPIDRLTAGWRRERSGIAVIISLGRKQAVWIDSGIGLGGFTCRMGHCFHHFGEDRICLADRHQDSNDAKRTGGRAVNEMDLHRIGLAVDEMFTRMMEMELHQFVAVRTNCQRAPAIEIELDGVAIVDDRFRLARPCELERRQPGFNRIVN
jgi:hypothetical protein